MFVARVTADVDALEQFMEWGGDRLDHLAPIVVGAPWLVMLVYSWQLALAVVVLVGPLLLLVLRRCRPSCSAAFDLVRTRVGEMLSEVSESVMGAAVVRAYGLDEHDPRAGQAIDRRPVPGRGGRALPGGDAVPHGRRSSAALALAVRRRASARSTAPTGGSTFGRVDRVPVPRDCSCTPSPTCPRSSTETQTAIAGWRKVLARAGPAGRGRGAVARRRSSRPGPCRCEAEDVGSRYRDGAGRPARRHLASPPGCTRRDRRRDRMREDHVRRSCCTRLADPRGGRIELDGVDLRRWRPPPAASASGWCRRTGSCSTPRVRENIRYGPGGRHRRRHRDRASRSSASASGWLPT